jgi:MOSC domain-containing protein YiiM
MIQAIFIAPRPEAQQQSATEIEVVTQKGIIGDRNFDQHHWPGQNITLIESEMIALFNLQQQQNIHDHDTRRNLITKDIKLNPLVGQIFYIGQIKLIGTELCQPCKSLSQALANDTLPQQQVIKAFTDKAGIRASILSSGHITIGMPITVDNTSS